MKKFVSKSIGVCVLLLMAAVVVTGVWGSRYGA